MKSGSIQKQLEAAANQIGYTLHIRRTSQIHILMGHNNKIIGFYLVKELAPAIPNKPLSRTWILTNTFLWPTKKTIETVTKSILKEDWTMPPVIFF